MGSIGGRSYRLAESDQTNEGILREEVEREQQRVLQCLKLLLPIGLDAEIDGEQKHWREASVARQHILERGVGRVHLCREPVLVDVGVLRGERIALETEGADPELACEIETADITCESMEIREKSCSAPEGVQDRATGALALYRLVVNLVRNVSRRGALQVLLNVPE